MNPSSTSSHNPMLNVAYIAVFAALIIVMGFVAVPVGTAGVPIVLQNAVVILAGLILGGKRGFLATALFLGLGILGLPVLPGGRSTLAALAGPTAGYLVGYLVAAFVAGVISYAAPRNQTTVWVATLFGAGIAGLFMQYFFGVLGLMFRAQMPLLEAILTNQPFVVFDTVKIVIAVIIAFGVLRAFPDLRK